MAFFCDVLCRSGWNVLVDEGVTILTNVQSTRQAIRKCESTLEIQKHRLDEFINGMGFFVENHIEMMLKTIELDIEIHLDPNNRSADPIRSEIQNRCGNTGDTLMKLLLSIEIVQRPLLDQLTLKILTLDSEMHLDNEAASIGQQQQSQSGWFNDRGIGIESGNSKNNSSKNDTKRQLILHILNHIRWCEYIYDSVWLISHLVDTTHALQDCSLVIEILSSLPTFAAEHHEHLLLNKLLDLLDTRSTDLLPCVIETIGNLCLPQGDPLLALAFEKVVSLLDTAEIEQLPVLTRFLLDNLEDDHTINDSAAEFFMRSLLSKLTTFLQSSAKIPNNRKNDNNLSVQSLIFNILKTSFQAKPLLFTIFQNVILIRTDDSQYTLSIVEIWIMLAVSSSPKYKRKVQAMIAREVSKGSLTFHNTSAAFSGFATSLDGEFGSIVKLAQSSTSNTTNASFNSQKDQIDLRKFSSWLFNILYDSYPYSEKRQEIIIALVSQIGAVATGSIRSISGIKYAGPACSYLAPHSKNNQIYSDDDIYQSSAVCLKVLLDISTRELESLKDDKSEDRPHSNDNEYIHRGPMLRQFLPFIKALIEDLCTTPENLLRGIFLLIFQCSICKLNDTLGTNSSAISKNKKSILFVEESAVDDVLVILKKYSDSRLDPQRRRIAIIGYVALLATIGPLVPPTNEVIGNTSSISSEKIVEKDSSNTHDLQSLMHIIFEKMQSSLCNNCSDNSASIHSDTHQAFMYDELSFALDRYLFYPVKTGNKTTFGTFGYTFLLYLSKIAQKGIDNMSNSSIHEWKRNTLFSTSQIGLNLSAISDKHLSDLLNEYTDEEVEQDSSNDQINSLEMKILCLVGGTSAMFSRTNFADTSSRVSASKKSESYNLHKTSVLVLPAALKLLGHCLQLLQLQPIEKQPRSRVEHASFDYLESIGSWLALNPVELPNEDTLNELRGSCTHDQFVMLGSLFHAVGWQRELLNIFSPFDVFMHGECGEAVETDANLKHFEHPSWRRNGHLVHCMNMLMVVEDTLLQQLQLFPIFLRAIASMNGYQLEYITTNNDRKGKKQKTTLKEGNITNPEFNETNEEFVTNNSDIIIDIPSLTKLHERFLFRKLHPDVGLILGIGLTRTQIDVRPWTNRNENEHELKLTTPAVRRLLNHIVKSCSDIDQESDIGDSCTSPLLNYLDKLHEAGVFVSLSILNCRVLRVLLGMHKEIMAPHGRDFISEMSSSKYRIKRTDEENVEDINELLPELRGVVSILLASLLAPKLVDELKIWILEDSSGECFSTKNLDEMEINDIFATQNAMHPYSAEEADDYMKHSSHKFPLLLRVLAESCNIPIIPMVQKLLQRWFPRQNGDILQTKHGPLSREVKCNIVSEILGGTINLYFDIANNLQYLLRPPNELRQPFLLDAMLSIIELLDNIMHLLDDICNSFKTEVDEIAIEKQFSIGKRTLSKEDDLAETQDLDGEEVEEDEGLRNSDSAKVKKSVRPNPRYKSFHSVLTIIDGRNTENIAHDGGRCRLSSLCNDLLELNWVHAEPDSRLQATCAGSLLIGTVAGPVRGNANTRPQLYSISNLVCPVEQEDISIPSWRNFSNCDIVHLLNLHLHWLPVNEQLHRLGYFAEILFEFEVQGDESDDQKYSILSRKTSVSFYTPLCQLLVDRWNLLIHSLSIEDLQIFRDVQDYGEYNSTSVNKKERIRRDNKLKYASAEMLKIVSHFESLVKITKVDDSGKHRVMLAAALRGGSKFVLAFLQGSDLLRTLFGSKVLREETIKTVNILQKSTRQLQHLCAYAKDQKDKVLAKEAPALRKALEQVLYGLKKLVEENHLSAALSIGHLKSRTLSGKEDKSLKHDQDRANNQAEDGEGGHNEKELDDNKSSNFADENYFGNEEQEEIDSDKKRPREIETDESNDDNSIDGPDGFIIHAGGCSSETQSDSEEDEEREIGEDENSLLNEQNLLS